MLAERTRVAQAVVTTYRVRAPASSSWSLTTSPPRTRRPADPDRALRAPARAATRATWSRPTWWSSPSIPVIHGGKADRKSLPPPSGPRHQAARGALHGAGHRDGTVSWRTALAACSAWTGSPRTPTSSTSSAPARCSWRGSSPRCRTSTTLPSVSMRAIYQNRTVRRLAAVDRPGHWRAGARRGAGPAAQDAAAMPVPADHSPWVSPSASRATSLCGALQLLVFARPDRAARARARRRFRLADSPAHGVQGRLERAVVFGVAPARARPRCRSPRSGCSSAAGSPGA